MRGGLGSRAAGTLACATCSTATNSTRSGSNSDRTPAARGARADRTAGVRSLALSHRQPRARRRQDELVDQVWGGRIVSLSTLASRINAARAAIRDDGVEQRLIRTVARRGYRFVSDVAATGARTATELRPRGPRQWIRFCVALGRRAYCLRRSGARSDDRESRHLPLRDVRIPSAPRQRGEWIKSTHCAGDKPLTLSQRGGRLPDSVHGRHRA